MKKYAPLFLIVIFFFACSKKNTTEPEMSYALQDLVGSWVGTLITSGHDTLGLKLQVDNTGEVSGSGVSSVWSIDQTGKVTGDGSFSFIAGSYLTVAGASWSLQLDKTKKHLSGTMDVSYPSLHDMAVDLKKQ